MQVAAPSTGYEIIPAWKQVTPELRDEVLAFWTEQKAIGDLAQARARAEQVVCIGRDEEQRLCAVATAVVRVLPRLRQPMYYYRQFFGEGHRGLRQTVPFVNRCKQVLQDYNAALERPEALGVLIELESRLLDERYRRAYEPSGDFTFIGYSPRGFQLRVSYFEGAVLQPPATAANAAPVAAR